MPKVKRISFKKFKEENKDLLFYNHYLLKAEDESNFIKNLTHEKKVSSLKNPFEEDVHRIMSNSKEDFISQVKKYHLELGCAQNEPLNNFEQDKTYLFLVGDPYEIIGTVRGYFGYFIEGSFYRDLLIETQNKNFLLVKIRVSPWKRGLVVRYIQILKEIKNPKNKK